METDGLGSVGCLCMNLHNIHTKKKKKKANVSCLIDTYVF